MRRLHCNNTNNKTTMASSSSTKSPRPLTIYLPPGPLGIGIKMCPNGECIVSSKSSNSKSPLKQCDVLLSLNGIPLVDVYGGVDAWCKLFGAFDTVERKVKVHRLSDTAATKTKNKKKVHVLQNSENSSPPRVINSKGVFNSLYSE